MVGIFVVGVAVSTFVEIRGENVDCVFMPVVEVSSSEEKFVSNSYRFKWFMIREHIECELVHPPANFLYNFDPFVF